MNTSDLKDGLVILAPGYEDVPKPIITSIRVDHVNRTHAHLSVWNRSAKCGTLCVNTEDAAAIVDRLIPGGKRFR